MARRRTILAGVFLLGPVVLNVAAALADQQAVRVEPLRSLDLLAPAVALAWVSDTRVLVLGSSDVRLLDTRTGALVDRLTLPGPVRAARIAAGLMLAEPEERSAWLLSNRRSEALLVEWSDERLSLRSEAPRMPWPDSPSGLQFVPGTNWIEGELAFCSGPFLSLDAGSSPSLAVSIDGGLIVQTQGGVGAEAPSRAVGPTLASLWPGWFAASTPRPPDEPDELVVLTTAAGILTEVLARPVSGAIRAVAARTLGPVASVAVVVEDAAGGFRLETLRLHREMR